jgi:hypothetical protein
LHLPSSNHLLKEHHESILFLSGLKRPALSIL